MEYERYKFSDLDFFKDKEAIYNQLAEEASEISQMASKLCRIYHGTNPTPLKQEEAEIALAEEVADLLICLDAIDNNVNVDNDRVILSNQTIADFMCVKKERWFERLNDTV